MSAPMFCGKCGKEAAADAKFCIACGDQLVADNDKRVSITDKRPTNEENASLAPEKNPSSWLDYFVNATLLIPPAGLFGAWVIYLARGGPSPLSWFFTPDVSSGTFLLIVLWPFALIYRLLHRDKIQTHLLMEDSAAKITQTAQQETQVDSDPQIKQSDSTSGATTSTDQAQPAGNKGAWITTIAVVGDKGVWITTIAVVMFLGLLVLGYEDLREQGSAASSTVSKREIAKEPVAPAISLAERDAEEQSILGFKYAKGQGVVQDYKEAVKWYRLAAEQGNAIAQHNLGVRYANGQGVLQDYKLAHMWFNIAAANGLAVAVQSRDALAKDMSSEDISKAQEMAREWVKNHP